MKSLILIMILLLGVTASFAGGAPIIFNPDDEAFGYDDGTLEGLRKQNRLLQRQIQELKQKLERLEQQQVQPQSNQTNLPRVQIVIPGSYAYPDQSYGSFGWGTMGGVFISAPMRDGHDKKDKNRHEHGWHDRQDRHDRFDRRR